MHIPQIQSERLCAACKVTCKKRERRENTLGRRRTQKSHGETPAEFGESTEATSVIPEIVREKNPF